MVHINVMRGAVFIRPHNVVAGESDRRQKNESEDHHKLRSRKTDPVPQSMIKGPLSADARRQLSAETFEQNFRKELVPLGVRMDAVGEVEFITTL